MTCSAQALVRFNEKASVEIGENEVDLSDTVQTLKELMAEKYGDLRLPPDADELLERSLRYRKFDMTRAATHLHAFFKLLRDMYEMHGDMYFVPSLYKQNYFDSFAATMLKSRDSKGRSVILYNIDRLPSDLFEIDHALTVFFLLMDEITRFSVETQRIGLVVVSNMTGFGFVHAKQFSLSRLRVTARMIQGAFPARFKGFHVVNAPSVFLCVYALLKPFLSEKIKKRISFHTGNFTEFHKKVSPDILPDFLGGKLSYEEAVDVGFTRRLVSKDEYYRDMDTWKMWKREGRTITLGYTHSRTGYS